MEETKRQVFDVVALQLHKHLPSFNDQDDKTKQLTLNLIIQALENDPKNLSKILTEVIELPKDKRDKLADLLESTTLTDIIDTMAEIKNRLSFLNGLEQIIYNPDLNKHFKERRPIFFNYYQNTYCICEYGMIYLLYLPYPIIPFSYPPNFLLNMFGVALLRLVD